MSEYSADNPFAPREWWPFVSRKRFEALRRERDEWRENWSLLHNSRPIHFAYDALAAKYGLCILTDNPLARFAP